MLSVDIRPIDEQSLVDLRKLDFSFESDRKYVVGRPTPSIYSVELVELVVDPPIHKTYPFTQLDLKTNSGFVASLDDEVVGGITLSIETWRNVCRIDDLLVDAKFRDHGIGRLLLAHAIEWAKRHNCWSLSAETQNVNYPAVQFYLRNGFEIWSVNEHLYLPGEYAEEIAIILGKTI